MRFARLLMIFSVFMLVSCNGPKPSFIDTKNRNYDDYYERFGINNLEEEFFYKDSNHYLIYIYSDTCSHCHNIKGVILDYLDSIIDETCNGITDIYIFNGSKDPNFRTYFKEKPKNWQSDGLQNTLITQMIGASSLAETYFFGTPSLYTIKDHVLSTFYLGEDTVGDYFYRNM